MTDDNPRRPTHPVDTLFTDRWSPRAYTPEEIPDAELLTMIEAGRWAASAYNSQPWRFLWARRDTPSWEKFLGLLVPFNRSWAGSAAALVFVVSNSTMVRPGADTPVPSRSHSYDAGAASANFALQATRMGWHAHGMAGVDMERAFVELGVPAGYRVEAAYAVGRRGDPAMLPAELQARETPSDRLALAEIAFEGGFPPAG